MTCTRWGCDGVFVLWLMIGCAGGMSSIPEPREPLNVLTSSDVARYDNALLAVQALRPSWIADRGDSRRDPILIVNGTIQPWMSMLSSVATDRVVEIRYLTAYELGQRKEAGNLRAFETGTKTSGRLTHGAIEVVTRL